MRRWDGSYGNTNIIMHAKFALASSAEHKRMTERVDTNSADWYGYPMAPRETDSL